MRRIVYLSKSTRTITKQDLDGILADARRSNIMHDVTGALIYHDGRFLQCLEGSHHDVQHLLEKIACARLHTDMNVIVDESVGERLFPDWAMRHTHCGSEAQKESFATLFKLIDNLCTATSRRSAARMVRDWLNSDSDVAA